MLQIYKIRTLILFMPVIFITGCTGRAPSDQAGMAAVKDMLGREVYVPSAVKKIAGLRAGALRLLIYMDASDMVAGIEEAERRGSRPYLTAHPELYDLPSLGPIMGGDAELILKSQPDVIFITYTTTGDADDLQKKTGIPVVALECPEFGTHRDILFASLQLIGKILHKEGRADSLITYIRSSVDDLNRRTAAIAKKDKPSVYIGGVPYSGTYGIISTQPYYPPFIFINAVNVASDIDKRLVSHVKGTYIDKEQLMKWNPDVLFIDQSGLSLVKEDLAKNTVLYNALDAVMNDKIYVLMPYNNYAVNYELVLANAWYAGKMLYPGSFADVDVEQKTNEISEMFLGKELYGEMTADSYIFRTMSKNDF